MIVHFIWATSEHFDVLLERAARYLIDGTRVALKRQFVPFLFLLFQLFLARRLDKFRLLLIFYNVHVLLLPANFRHITLIRLLTIFKLQATFFLP